MVIFSTNLGKWNTRNRENYYKRFETSHNTEAAFAQQECEEEEPDMVCQTEQLAKECW